MTERAGLKRKKKCLVIGGGGFVGSHLVSDLVGMGRHVTLLGRSAAPQFPVQSEADYVRGCFSDLNLLSRLLDEHHEVVHLAYATVPNTSFDNPLADLLENLPPTVQLFSEAAARGNRLILVSSGGTVYGEAISLPISEEHPTKPISPYGLTKLTLERYAQLYRVKNGLDVVCIRPSNAYGEGQRPFTGQGFVATAIASALMGKPITIFGENGSIRDYLHVEDIASGIALALEYGKSGETYNLGSGIGLSNYDVLSKIMPFMHRIGCPVEVIRTKPRSFDVKKNVLNSSALHRDTGWIQRINVDDGVFRTCEWLQRTFKTTSTN